MTRYVGLDVHKRFIEYCILDATGKKLSRGQTACIRATLEDFATTVLEPTDQVALEASTNTWSVAAILRPHVARITVSNPMRTKAIAEAKVKTDKVDAHVLAQLLRCDYLPQRVAARSGYRTTASPHNSACDPDNRTRARQESDPKPHRPLTLGAAVQGALD